MGRKAHGCRNTFRMERRMAAAGRRAGEAIPRDTKRVLKNVRDDAARALQEQHGLAVYECDTNSL